MGAVTLASQRIHRAATKPPLARLLVGGGLGLAANGSINHATFKGSKPGVPPVPAATAAGGFVYDHVSGFLASFTGKYVGSWAVYDNSTNPGIAGGGAARQKSSDRCWRGDLAVGYGTRLGHGIIRNFKARRPVSNIFNPKRRVLESIGANPAKACTKDAFKRRPRAQLFPDGVR